MNLPDMDEATRQLILDSIRANAASDEEEDEDDIQQMLSDNPIAERDTDTANADDTAATGATAMDVMGAEEADIVTTASGHSTTVPAAAQATQVPFRKLDTDSMEDYDQWDQSYWQDSMPEAVDAAVAAAQIWSRIIRPPRKRGKHIIIDACSPREDAINPDAVDTSQGRLVRQVVATTDKKTWLGPGGYRLARKSRWGDLWPKYYQDYATTHKL